MGAFEDETSDRLLIYVDLNVSTVQPSPPQTVCLCAPERIVWLFEKSADAIVQLWLNHHIYPGHGPGRDYDYVVIPVTPFMVTHLSHSRTKLAELLAALEQPVTTVYSCACTSGYLNIRFLIQSTGGVQEGLSHVQPHTTCAFQWDYAKGYAKGENVEWLLRYATTGNSEKLRH